MLQRKTNGGLETTQQKSGCTDNPLLKLTDMLIDRSAFLISALHVDELLASRSVCFMSGKKPPLPVPIGYDNTSTLKTEAVCWCQTLITIYKTQRVTTHKTTADVSPPRKTRANEAQFLSVRQINDQ